MTNIQATESVNYPFRLHRIYLLKLWSHDRLCSLVVRVRGYRSGGPGFDSRALQEKKVVGLERGPLVCTAEELFGRNSKGFCQKSENTAVGIRHADNVAPSIRKKWALTSLTSGGRLVGMVRLRAEATEFFL
jgi:hypothetical protein